MNNIIVNNHTDTLNIWYKLDLYNAVPDVSNTIFVSKKPRVERYPTMEITTVSPVLALQLRESLLKRGFRVGNIRKSTSKLSKLPAYRIPLYGRENVRKWLKEIGFSNKYKLERAKSYIE